MTVWFDKDSLLYRCEGFVSGKWRSGLGSSHAQAVEDALLRQYPY